MNGDTNMHRITLLLVVLAVSATHAANIDFSASAVDGAAISSAEFARDIESSNETLIVRIRNDNAVGGENLYLASVVRDAEGNAKRGSCTGFAVPVSIGSEQAFSLAVASLETTDTVTLELIDIDGMASNDDVCPICEWCASSAAQICGTRNVGSVSCSCSAGSCTFTCQD